MKIAALVSALEELGTVFRHSTKDEPAACITQVLKLLRGNENLSLSDLTVAPAGKKTGGKSSPHFCAGSYGQRKRNREGTRGVAGRV